MASAGTAAPTSAADDSSVTNRKKMETARRFLWDEDEMEASVAPSANAGFASQRNDYNNVDQSVNLMAMSDINMASSAYPKKKQQQQRVGPLAQLLRERCTAPTLACSVCLLLLAIVAVVGWTHSHNNGPAFSDVLDGNSHSDHDSAMPYRRVSWTESEKTFANALVRDGVSTQHDLHNQFSPQYKAMQWILDDPSLDAVSAPSDERVRSRYILGVFHHATQGDRWNFAAPSLWMSNKQTNGYCMWQGVSCVPRSYTGDKGERPVAPNEGDDTSDYTDSTAAFPSDEVLTRTYDDDGQIIYLKLPNSNLESRQLPKELFFLPYLSVLDLSMNQIEGTLPDLRNTLSAIRVLNLSSNQIGGRLRFGDENDDRSDNSDSNMDEQVSKTLHELYLHQNQFTGTLSDTFIRRLPAIRTLTLHSNRLEGSIPSSIVVMRKLQHLSLHSNAFTGSLTDAAMETWSPTILSLELQHNTLTGKLPTSLESLRRLELMNIGHNQLTGGIPNFFAYFPRLVELNLQHNQLRYTIPESMHQLSDLKRLYLDHNKLTGSVPVHFSSLIDLKVFHVNNNRLGYEVPSSLGQLADLIDLRIHHNRIHGTIPTELGNCYRLQYLMLGSNARLTGTVPSELGKLEDLRVLRMDNMTVNGEVPGEICTLRSDNELQVLTSDCGETARVTCDCCTKCY